MNPFDCILLRDLGEQVEHKPVNIFERVML